MHDLDLPITLFWRLILHYHDTFIPVISSMFPDGLNVELMAIIQVAPYRLMRFEGSVILAMFSKTRAVPMSSLVFPMAVLGIL